MKTRVPTTSRSSRPRPSIGASWPRSSCTVSKARTRACGSLAVKTESGMPRRTTKSASGTTIEAARRRPDASWIPTSSRLARTFEKPRPSASRAERRSGVTAGGLRPWAGGYRVPSGSRPRRARSPPPSRRGARRGQPSAASPADPCGQVRVRGELQAEIAGEEGGQAMGIAMVEDQVQRVLDERESGSALPTRR